MKLSILVCSIVTRKPFLERLMLCLEPQLIDDVELLVACDDGEISIGAKRNYLIEQSTGDYVCFVDDDDTLGSTYVSDIIAAMDQKPDCIGFLVRRLVNGKPDPKDAIHSLRFAAWGETKQDGKTYYCRTPNHLNPIRREIAVKVPFKAIDFAEDRDYSQRITPLLKSEVYIDKPLYIYDYRSQRPGEVTHLTRAKR